MRSAALVLACAMLLIGVSAEAEDASNAAYQFTLAKMLAFEGSVREAENAYAEALRQAPADVYLRIDYAVFLSRVRRLAAAMEQAEKAVELAPENTDALRGLARLQMALAEDDSLALEHARQTFETLRKLDPADVESMVSLGQIYLSQDQASRAADVLLEASSYQPDNGVVRSLLVDALLRSDRTSEAEQALLEILESDPGSLESRLALAEILSQRRDHNAAVALLQDAPLDIRGDPQLRRFLALELFRAGRSQDALNVIDALTRERPELREALYLQAVILISLDRTEEAKGLLGSLHRASPENLQITSTLSRVLEGQGRVDEAARLLEDQAEILEERERPGPANQVRLEQIRLYARNGYWEEAVALAAPLMGKIDEGSEIDLLLMYAETLSRMGRETDALEVLRDHRAWREKDPQVLVKEAEILYELGKRQKAKALLTRVAEQGSLEDTLLVIDAFQQLEEYADSIPLLLRVKESDGETIEVLFRLGAAYERAGQRSEAIDSFRRLLELEPEFSPALNYLGYMWAEKGENLQEALDLIQRAVALDPNNGAYVDSLGWAHFQLGQLEEARDHLERAANLIPDDTTILEHLGDLYSLLGDIEKARAAYRRAAQLEDENLDQVQRKLRALEGEE